MKASSFCFFLNIGIICGQITVSNNTVDDQSSKMSSEDQIALKWSQLTRQAAYIYNILNEPLVNDKLTSTPRFSLVLMVYQQLSEHVLPSFEKELTQGDNDLMLITCQLPVSFTKDHVVSRLTKATNAGDILAVFVLAETTKFATDLLEVVSQESVFKWTSLKHTTEWIVMSISYNLLDSISNERTIDVDFMTLIFFSIKGHLTITQKSRKEKFDKILIMAHVNHDCGDILDSKVKDTSHMQTENGMELYMLCCETDYIYNLRKLAVHFLETQSSVLDGLSLPVAVLPEIENKFYNYFQEGNQTIYDGYSMDLLKTLSEFMGFTYTLVSKDDHGFYGEVKDNGEADGITGQLARREAALTTLPLSITETRRTRIDYISTPTVVENINIIYKLPVQTDHLDLTYLDIFQGDFILYLLGPIVIVGIIGAVIHVLTNSCYSHTPGKFRRENLRLLWSFPDHICFHTERTYKVQSGLILRTSWAIFWFIISSAYSAYLVTTFTVKPPELTLKTFKQLMEHQEYMIGMYQHDTSLQTFIKMSSDRTLNQLWARLQQENKTDPSTFSALIEFHCDRVLQGNYAFIVLTSLDLLPQSQYPDVRTFTQRGFESINHAYIGVPQNTFYYQDMSNVLRSLDESGILEKLKTAYFTAQLKTSATSKVTSNEAVTFHRIKLPVYCAVSGLIFSLLFLLLENVLYRLTHRSYHVTQTVIEPD